MKLVTYRGSAHVLEVKDVDGDMWYFPKDERQAVPDDVADLISERKDTTIENELVLPALESDHEFVSHDPFPDDVEEE